MDLLTFLTIAMMALPAYVMIYRCFSFIGAKYNVIEAAGMQIINATITRIIYNEYELKDMVDEYNGCIKQLQDWGDESTWYNLSYSSDPKQIITSLKKINKYILELRFRKVVTIGWLFFANNGSPLFNNITSQLGLSDAIVDLVTQFIAKF